MSIIKKKKKSSGPIWNSFLRCLAESREHLSWLVVTKENLALGIRDGKKIYEIFSPSSLRSHI